jgi:predicted MPP superfamily phosphohydrolase
VTVVAHLSDLHFGTEEPELVRALLAALREAAPALVVVSGDLTQRARGPEFAAARAFLDALPAPWLCVPGNHDLPLDRPARLFAPRAAYHRHITRERHPWFATQGLAVAGIDTTRARRWKSGSVRARWAVERLRDAPPEALRVLVTHHPVAGAAFTLAAAAGADVLLAGHLHIGGPAELREGRLVLQAGTALSARRRGEPNGWNLLRWEAPSLAVAEHVWDGAWTAARTDRFTRGDDGAWLVD